MRPNTLESLAIDFWERVTKTPDGCLVWKGAKLASGYGLVRIGGKWKLAHRIAWTLAHGEIPNGAEVLHRCDNPPCVNDDHLFLGTQGDNNRDRSAKGRTRVPVGVEQNFAKLDDDSVRKIRDMFSKGILKTHIALMFNVDRGTVDAILKRRTWKHVDA